jgi:Flp pilus assembly pilin Flp
MKALWTRLIRDESGQTMTEYALMVALVAVFLIAIIVIFRNSVSNVFSTAKDSLNAAP